MPFVAIPKRESFLGLFRIELLLCALVGATIGLYNLFALSFRAPLGLYLERIGGTIPCYAVGLALTALILRLKHLRHGFRMKQLVQHRYTWQIFREFYLGRKSLIHDFRLLNATCIMFVVFVNLKHLIPFIHGSVFDYQLDRVERAIFHGSIAAEILHELLGVEVAPLLSSCYTLFYSYVAFVIYLFVLQRNRALAHEFLLAFFLVWFGGLTIAYLYPTRGPIFFTPDTFALLPNTEVTSMQQKLWLHKLALDQNPFHRNATYLISGLPSLHLAVPILGSLYLPRLSWALAVLSWTFVLLTAITTVYFGWHWILDDLAAVLLAVGVARTTKRWYRPHYLYVPYPSQPPAPR